MNSNMQSTNSSETDSKDEPDSVQVKTNNAKKDVCKKSMNPLKRGFLSLPKSRKTSLYGDCEVQNVVKSHLSAFPFFISSDKCAAKEKENRPKLIKSKSLARLFGNNYSTKNTHQVSKPSNIEKFHNKSNEIDSASAVTNTTPTISKNTYHHIDENEKVKDVTDNAFTSLDPSNFQETSNLKTLRLLSKSIGKLFRRNCDTLEISKPDLEYKVLYLGNVLTGFAKGKTIYFFSKH
jgi:hypothetical protein